LEILPEEELRWVRDGPARFVEKTYDVSQRAPPLLAGEDWSNEPVSLTVSQIVDQKNTTRKHKRPPVWHIFLPRQELACILLGRGEASKNEAKNANEKLPPSMTDLGGSIVNTIFRCPVSAFNLVIKTITKTESTINRSGPDGSVLRTLVHT
jgi:hypothetical protein